MSKNRVQHTINAQLSNIEFTQKNKRAVYAMAKGEIKVKKKLSLGLVLAIVLVLAAMTALAAALLWEQQVVPMKEIEQTEGDYIHWPVSQKQVLIRALTDSGHIAESSETTRLFDDATGETEKHAIADQLLLTLIGQTDVAEISVDIITYAIMGAPETWTPQQRVWWQQVTDKFYEKQNPDTLIVPSADVISEAEAVAIAKAALLAAYELPANALDRARIVADLYITEQRPDYRRWHIQFQVFREGSDSYVEHFYTAIVDEHGQVIDDPDVMVSLPGEGFNKTMKELLDEKGHYIFWTHEERAQHMPERFTMPAAGTISEEEAIRIAWEAARSNEKFQSLDLDGFTAYAMYGAAMPDNALCPNDYWHVTLAINLTRDYETERDANVYINAKTGEVFYTF